MTAAPRLSEPLPGHLEALLYDWHNEHRLVEQSADTEYWARTLRDYESIAVLGAGTGRMVRALHRDRPERRIVAVDRNGARLARLNGLAGIQTVVADFRLLGGIEPVGAILFPYSSFQLLTDVEGRVASLERAVRVLRPGGEIALDLSTSFDRRLSRSWELTLSGHCAELDASVEEWERSVRTRRGLTVTRRYRVACRDAGEVVEHWALESTLGLPELLSDAGLSVAPPVAGYGGSRSPHRRIYRGFAPSSPPGRVASRAGRPAVRPRRSTPSSQSGHRRSRR